MVLERMLDLPMTEKRSERIWADKQHKIVCAIDPSTDFFPPFGRIIDVVQIDPGFTLARAERFKDFSDKLGISTGIRKEYVTH
jgi:hypothetical protein